MPNSLKQNLRGTSSSNSKQLAACPPISGKAQSMLQKVWRSASSRLSSKLHPVVSLLLPVSHCMIDKRLSLPRTRMALWKQSKPQKLNQKVQKDPAMSALERPPREIQPQKFLKNIVHWDQPEKYTIKEFSKIIVRLFWEQCTHSPENAMVRPIPICE